jgi:hypothetical protein
MQLYQTCSVGIMQPPAQKEREYLRVPLRATTFSTLCLLPLLIFGVAKAMLGRPEAAVYIMLSISTVYSSVRVPATVALTFKGDKEEDVRAKGCNSDGAEQGQLAHDNDIVVERQVSTV